MLLYLSSYIFKSSSFKEEDVLTTNQIQADSVLIRWLMGLLHHNLEVIDFECVPCLPANLTFSFANTNILDFDCVPIGVIHVPIATTSLRLINASVKLFRQ